MEENISGGKTGSAAAIVDKIFNQPSECAIDKKQGPVCSPKSVVGKMADFAKAKGVVIQSTHPEKIVGTMKELMDCNSESCVLRNPEFVKFAQINKIDGILNEFFKPEGPSTDFAWLNNSNIDNVLDQLQNKFPGFLHIPYQMRDFEKVGTELATVDLAKEFSNGTKSFGVILNTDYSSGNGIHWYCLFGEKKNGKIILEYFNSSGQPPLPETQAWLQKTKHYLQSKLGVTVEIKYSTGVEFQRDKHSCGVFSLMYIWLRLEGIPNNWFKVDTFTDDMMHQARKILFRKEV